MGLGKDQDAGIVLDPRDDPGRDLTERGVVSEKAVRNSINTSSVVMISTPRNDRPTCIALACHWSLGWAMAIQ